MIAAEQARAFGAMLLCGAICALAHDVMRLALWLIGGRAGVTAMMDLMLGALLAAGMTGTGLVLGINPMRLYLFAGIMLGALLWYATGGRGGRLLGAWLLGRFAREEKREN